MADDVVILADTDLTTTESQTLSACESTIAAGLKTFVAVGEALLTIREQKLYRAAYATFEEYCGERWQMSKTHANRLVSAAQVVGNLAPIGVIPETESQARPLTALPAAQQPEAWQRAVDTAPNGKVTAAHVASVVEEINPTARTRQLLTSGASDEWYTPRVIVDRVLELWQDDAVDLDPCSPTDDYTRAPVPARRYYTAADNGLAQPWEGRVYLNPPYSDMTPWVARLIDAYDGGEIEEAVALVKAATETQWFQGLNRYHRCEIVGRVSFVRPDGSTGPATFPSVVVYLGSDLARFRSVFSDLGRVIPGEMPVSAAALTATPDAPPEQVIVATSGTDRTAEVEPVVERSAFDDLRDVAESVLHRLSALGYDLIRTRDRGIARDYTFRDAGSADNDEITLPAGQVPRFLAEQESLAQRYAVARQVTQAAPPADPMPAELRQRAQAEQPAPAAPAPIDKALWQTAVAQLDDAITAITGGERRTAITGAISAVTMLITDAEAAQLVDECKQLVEWSSDVPQFAAVARVIARAVGL